MKTKCKGKNSVTLVLVINIKDKNFLSTLAAGFKSATSLTYLPLTSSCATHYRLQGLSDQYHMLLSTIHNKGFAHKTDILLKRKKKHLTGQHLLTQTLTRGSHTGRLRPSKSSSIFFSSTGRCQSLKHARKEERTKRMTNTNQLLGHTETKILQKKKTDEEENGSLPSCMPEA